MVMARKLTAENAAKKILKFRSEGVPDKHIREEHPQLEKGWAYLAQQAGGSEAAPRPRSSGPAMTERPTRAFDGGRTELPRLITG
jgi:hypothetical protein